MGSTNIRAEALLLVNQWRRVLELPELRELPKGRLQDPTCCPLARALNVKQINTRSLQLTENELPLSEELANSLNVYYQRRYGGSECFMGVPSTFALFIRQFDKRLMPDLIEEN